MEVKLISSPQSPDGSYRFGVASLEEGLMGHAIAFLKCEAYYRWVIDELEIYPRFRGQGYGSKLLDYACDRLQEIRPNTPILVHPEAPGFVPIKEFMTKLKTGDTSIFESTIQDLIEWYKRHGFSGDRMMVKAPFVLIGR